MKTEHLAQIEQLLSRQRSEIMSFKALHAENMPSSVGIALEREANRLQKLALTAWQEIPTNEIPLSDDVVERSGL